MSEIQDNPYSAFLGVVHDDMDEHTVASWRIGILRSLSPPAVELGGQLVTHGVSINALLQEYSGPMSISSFTGSVQGSPEDMQVSGGSLTGVGTFGPAVAPGDQVTVLQSSNGQEYVILCKVV